MTPRRRTPPRKTDWLKVAGLAATITFAVLNLVWAWFLFNNDTMHRITVLETKQDVLWQRETERERRREPSRE